MLLEIAFGSDVRYILSIVYYGSFKKQMVFFLFLWLSSYNSKKKKKK